MGVYVRLGSTNRKADQDLIAELKRGAQGKSFDEQLLPDRTVDDLDFDAATACFERHRKLVKKDLESLRLVARHQSHLVPTVGGMLLFGKDREMVFRMHGYNAGVLSVRTGQIFSIISISMSTYL